jgi:ABC-type polysaccharide/polyol phosphate export permease
MKRNKTTYLAVVGQLLRRDLISYRKDFWNKLLDTAIMLITNIAVFAYFMPQMGLSSNYGPFFLISAITCFGFFDTVGKISVMMADLEGDRTISYLLTLPIPATFVFLYFAIWWAITSGLTALFLFPMGKLLLWNQFDLSAISYWRLGLIFISINLFYGFFSLWLTAMLAKMTSMQHLWVRILIPLYMFGAYFYPWSVLYNISPLAGILTLINPVVFAMEGMRSAALGPSGSIPFAISFFCLWAFILLFAKWAIVRLKKRLDCV